MGFFLGLLIGLFGALAVNEIWYRSSLKDNDEWDEFCTTILKEWEESNNRWYNHCEDLRKKYEKE